MCAFLPSLAGLLSHERRPFTAEEKEEEKEEERRPALAFYTYTPHAERRTVEEAKHYSSSSFSPFSLWIHSRRGGRRRRVKREVSGRRDGRPKVGEPSFSLRIVVCGGRPIGEELLLYCVTAAALNLSDGVCLSSPLLPLPLRLI